MKVFNQGSPMAIGTVLGNAKGGYLELGFFEVSRSGSLKFQELVGDTFLSHEDEYPLTLFRKV